MEKEKIREIVRKSVEDCWYNRRSLNPVEEQTEFLTEELYKALRQPPVIKAVCEHDIIHRYENIENIWICRMCELLGKQTVL